MKTGRFLIFILLMSLFGEQQAFAQFNASENMDRYWFYRNRLNNYFIAVGQDSGQSLPFIVRNANDDNSSEVRENLFMEESTINLGRHIGLLATEYRLLLNNGQDVERTRSIKPTTNNPLIS